MQARDPELARQLEVEVLPALLMTNMRELLQATFVSSGALHPESLQDSAPKSWSNLKSDRVSIHGYDVINNRFSDC